MQTQEELAYKPQVSGLFLPPPKPTALTACLNIAAAGSQHSTRLMPGPGCLVLSHV